MEKDLSYELKENLRKQLIAKIKRGNHTEVREFLLFHGNNLHAFSTVIHSYFD